MAKHATAAKELEVQGEPDVLPPISPTKDQQLQSNLKSAIDGLVESEVIEMLALRKKNDAAEIARAAEAEWTEANQNQQKARLALTAAIRLAKNIV